MGNKKNYDIEEFVKYNLGMNNNEGHSSQKSLVKQNILLKECLLYGSYTVLYNSAHSIFQIH